jgi:hypothetical protein
MSFISFKSILIPCIDSMNMKIKLLPHRFFFLLRFLSHRVITRFFHWITDSFRLVLHFFNCLNEKFDFWFFIDYQEMKAIFGWTVVSSLIRYATNLYFYFSCLHSDYWSLANLSNLSSLEQLSIQYLWSHNHFIKVNTVTLVIEQITCTTNTN